MSLGRGMGAIERRKEKKRGEKREERRRTTPKGILGKTKGKGRGEGRERGGRGEGEGRGFTYISLVVYPSDTFVYFYIICFFSE